VFGVLPVVSGTDYLWIVIDPDASAGTPEIVKVTAHASASTTVTVSRGQQASVARAHLANVRVTSPVTKADLDSFLTGAGDLVDGSVATAKLADSAITTSKIADDAVTQAKVADDAVGMAQLASDVFTYSSGDIKQSIRDVAEAGWLLLNGAAIASASSLYPSLWAVAPASWKSGTTLTLPNMTDRILQGPASGSSAGIGSTNGSNTVTLSTAHMPSHAHTMHHNHPSATTNTDTHNHTMLGNGIPADYVDIPNYAMMRNLAAGSDHYGALGQNRITPTMATDSHSHSLDVPNFTGSTGSSGSGSAFGIEQAALRVNYFIKT
tara:strand:+ start:1360 stop:2325 length:966 start_codon:yes stop_codon:yes gene_type:complete